MEFTSFDDIRIGDKAEFERVISTEDVDLFAKLTGDFNPVHINDAYAMKTRFKGRVAHGMLTASFISRIIGMTLPGRGALYLSQNCEFLVPVKIGDRIRVVVVVEQIHKSTNILSLKTRIFNHEGTLVINGNAKVMVMPDLQEEKIKSIEDEGKIIASEQASDHLEDEINLKNKVVLVTGSGRGIGAGIAHILSLAGASVVINYLKDNASADQVADEINRSGRGRAIAVKADISDSGEVKDMFTRIREKFGDIDILINNASPSLNNKAFVSTGWSDFETHINTILNGTYNCCQEAIEGMKRKGGGKIINIVSSIIYRPQKSLSSYMTAKFGLMGMSKGMALELATFNISVNTVSPGMTDTDLIGHIPELIKKTAGARLPLKRIATPRDIAKVVLFLASSGADYMTGVDIPVCGGENI